MTEKQVESGGSQSAEQILEPWFGTAFSRLSEPIQKLAAQVVGPRKWHELRPTARRKAAQSFDLAVAEWKKLKASLPPRGSQPANPEDEAAATIAWYDATMDAKHWFGMPAVDPELAAMLLCEHNPTTDSPARARSITTSHTTPADFARLVQRFDAETKVRPQHRSLLDWLCLAQDSMLRYHPWVDEYVLAAGIAISSAADDVTPGLAKPTSPAPNLESSSPDPVNAKANTHKHVLARDLLAPLIHRVIAALDANASPAECMAELERLARLPDSERPAPLAGVNSGGVQWRDGGQTKTLSRGALGERLRRRAAPRQPTPTHAEPRG